MTCTVSDVYRERTRVPQSISHNYRVVAGITMSHNELQLKWHESQLKWHESQLKWHESQLQSGGRHQPGITLQMPYALSETNSLQPARYSHVPIAGCSCAPRKRRAGRKQPALQPTCNLESDNRPISLVEQRLEQGGGGGAAHRGGAKQTQAHVS